MKIRLISLLLPFFYCGILLGQTLVPKIPPSPNAASLGEYGMVPIDHYVGAVTPKINVYEYDLNGFKFNIDFSYRNTGLRYSQESSVVGLGWVLNAGGVITRVKNIRDDFSQKGYYYINPSDIKFGETDAEPDIFYYNFNGISGSFLVSNGNIVIIKKDSELSVKYNSNSGFFSVLDSRGVEYKFEKKEMTSGIIRDSQGERQIDSYISSWYLTSVILPNKEKILLEYIGGETIVQNKFTRGGINIIPLSTPPCEQNVQSGQILNTQVSMFNDEVLLSRITGPNFAAEFVYGNRSDLSTRSNSSAKKMISFTVKNSSNDLIKNVALNQSYFSSSNNVDYYSKRLKLNNISINNDLYGFEYDEQGMPDKNSLDFKDFSFIESAPFVSLLKKIIYPTKGYTKFFYEQNSYYIKHQYSEDVPSVQLGVRIKEIENYDIIANNNTEILLTKKIYEYGNSQRTSGKLISGFLRSYKYTTNLEIKYCQVIENGKPVNKPFHSQKSVEYIYRENSIPLSGNNVIVGYDRVTIKNVIGNIDNGKEEYIFRNNITDYMTFIPNCLGNVDFNNGTLLSKTSYQSKAGIYYPLKKDSVIYNMVNQGNFKGVVFLGSGSSLRIGEYSISANKLLLGGKLEYEYYSGLPNLLEKTDYTYLTDKILVKEESVTNSLGQVVKTRYKYPSEYATTPLNIYKNMTELNMLDIPIETVVSRDGNIISAEVMSHKLFEVPNIIRTAGHYQLNINKPLLASLFSESSIGSDGELTLDSRYLLKQQVLACDAYGNATQIKSPSSTEKNLLWGYNGQYPVIEIDNANNDKFNESISEQYDGLNLSLPGEATMEFKVGASGNVTLEFRAGTFLSTNDTYYVNYWITGPQNFTGYFCRNNSPGTSCYNNPDLYKKLFMNMLPGVYKLRIQSPNSNPNSVAYVALTYPKKFYQVSVGKEYFYEGFENDNTAATTGAFLGNRYHQGAYTVLFKMPTTKKYIIDYKYRSGGKWLTASKSYVNDMTLADGDAIDEVRIYPIGAKMTTYTYKPLTGMTSRTDGKGLSEVYEYDAQGRLILIKDNKEHITKAFKYNIKAN